MTDIENTVLGIVQDTADYLDRACASLQPFYGYWY